MENIKIEDTIIETAETVETAEAIKVADEVKEEVAKDTATEIPAEQQPEVTQTADTAATPQVDL